MKAGQTDLTVGTRVELHTNDKDLNGQTGFITHPFAFGETKKGWVGVYLEKTITYGDKCNVRASEVKIL